MREDYLEKLDDMFPQGYIILYTNPNHTFRMTKFNPFGYKLISDIHKLLKGSIKDPFKGDL